MISQTERSLALYPRMFISLQETSLKSLMSVPVNSPTHKRNRPAKTDQYKIPLFLKIQLKEIPRTSSISVHHRQNVRPYLGFSFCTLRYE